MVLKKEHLTAKHSLITILRNGSVYRSERYFQLHTEVSDLGS